MAYETGGACNQCKNRRHLMNTRKTVLATAITMALGGGSFTASADLTSSTTLLFTLGTSQPVACTYGTAPPCSKDSYNITDIVGSYFGMDTNGNGIEAWEKTPIGSFNGLHFGSTQLAGGSHSGPINGTESPNIDNPWTFFGGTGMHQTTAPVTVVSDLGSTKTLDMSGWNLTWRGIPSITMVPQGDASIICDTNACDDGEAYILDAAFHMSSAGFTTVPYSLHLEGNVGILPPSISIDIEGGAVQECDIPNGNNITMSASVFTPEPGDVASITWFLDDNLAGEGAVVEIFVPLGTHIIKAILQTTQSGSAESEVEVTVRDTVDPLIDAAFVDPKTGSPVTEIIGNGDVKVSITAEATDVCDPQPAVSMTVGTPAHVGDTVVINVSKKKPTVETSSATVQDSVELITTAEDTSGNVAVDTSVLTITE